ncbi:MAG: hypothetical protein JW702_05400 [Clostridiales bacterium]|nr:hypothetical protein [Clostridiales bacterium]
MKKWIIAILLLMLIGIVAIIVIPGDGQNKNASNNSYTEPEVDKIIEDPIYGEIIVNEMIVLMEEGQGVDVLKQISEENNLEIVGQNELLSLYQVRMISEDINETLQMISLLRENESISQVSLHPILVNYDMEGELWSPLNTDGYLAHDNFIMMENMGFSNAWRFIKGSKIELHPVVVGILDRGIDKNNEEIGGSINYELTYGTDPKSPLTHGSQVLNVIAGNYKDNIGISGIASILDNQLTVISNNIFDEKLSKT